MTCLTEGEGLALRPSEASYKNGIVRVLKGPILMKGALYAPNRL